MAHVQVKAQSLNWPRLPFQWDNRKQGKCHSRKGRHRIFDFFLNPREFENFMRANKNLRMKAGKRLCKFYSLAFKITRFLFIAKIHREDTQGISLSKEK